MSRQDMFVARDAKAPDGVRIQYGALCWRQSVSGIEVLLITSRDTGRWVIPKGWPMAGLAPEAAAAQEAWEEAGVRGVVDPVCLGRFGYLKCVTPMATVPCAVAVYSLRVGDLATRFPEMKERTRQWFSQAEAADLVDESDLRRIIEAFVPPSKGRAGPIVAE
ncbi:NUDIX hydrolase [Tabrizicola sp.]|uniref:NUDIX hydrolase n=1 Tax=Tabrizicola sp. TaxID=2005166 RepID=UPI00286CFE3D|nr:NUDIX hydrolase [Tabrizicola sp.]